MNYILKAMSFNFYIIQIYYIILLWSVEEIINNHFTINLNNNNATSSISFRDKLIKYKVKKIRVYLKITNELITYDWYRY